MPTTTRDHPALARLVEFERRYLSDPVPDTQPPLGAALTPKQAASRKRVSMGYQPALDGLRALAVLGVIAYHAGFGWIPGGWIGVEVFFVVSGFLITSLLIDERAGSGRVSLGQFWVRRARRLLPALAVVLVTVAIVTAAVGTADQQAQLRRDLPWAIFYAGNWGQIAGSIPYYAAHPPLLRHLWSLAVEEQWYLIWPLAFLALVAVIKRRSRIATLLLLAAVAVMVFTSVVYGRGPGPIRSSVSFLDGADRVNFLYLSTLTRSSGLLLGAAAAFVWRPWRRKSAPALPPLDWIGGAAVAGLAVIAASAHVTDGATYRWLLAAVSVLSTIAVTVAVHPGAHVVRRVLAARPLVVVGVRSYGLYLWHWPIFVWTGATTGAASRFLLAAAITVVVSELCFRLVETPLRRGALGRWWRSHREGRDLALAGSGAVALALALFYSTVTPSDRAVGGEEAEFVAPILTTAPTLPPPAGSAEIGAPTTTTPPGPTLPLHVSIVGDSVAHSIAVNLPNGIGSTFDVSDGSVSGCSVYPNGEIFTQRPNFSNSFAMCADWIDDWTDAVVENDSSLALVVLGAWDVFDVEVDGTTYEFGSSTWDEMFLGHLQEGIDSMVRSGADVALLEVACMRPINAEGAAVPPLPERADDARVDHLNELLRRSAASNPETTTFVTGPDEWCTDEAVSSDTGLRWDGVHPYKPGVAMIFDAITPQLLEIGGL